MEFKRKFLLSVLLILPLPTVIFGQQNFLWWGMYGGEADDCGYSFKKTVDNGYTIVGETSSFGNGLKDVYLIKTDSIGHFVWSKTFGGNRNDVGYGIEKLEDQGFIIVGYSESIGSGGADVYLIRADSLGNILWSKTFGGNRNDVGYGIEELEDQGFIIVGYSESIGSGGADVYLIRADSLGNILWSKTFGGNRNDVGYTILRDNNNYVIVGDTKSFGAGGSDVYFIKVDSEGEKLLERTYGSAGDEYGRGIAKIDDCYYVTGFTDIKGNKDIYLAKIDSTGTIIWQRTYGGEKDEYCYSICTTEKGEIVIAGSTESYGWGKSDVYIMKIDLSGKVLWTQLFGGLEEERARFISAEREGRYLLTGGAESYGVGYRENAFLMKTKSEFGYDKGLSARPPFLIDPLDFVLIVVVFIGWFFFKALAGLSP